MFTLGKKHNNKKHFHTKVTKSQWHIDTLESVVVRSKFLLIWFLQKQFMEYEFLFTGTHHSQTASCSCCVTPPPLFWCPVFVTKMQRCQLWRGKHQRPRRETAIQSHLSTSEVVSAHPSHCKQHLEHPAQFDLGVCHCVMYFNDPFRYAGSLVSE